MLSSIDYLSDDERDNRNHIESSHCIETRIKVNSIKIKSISMRGFLNSNCLFKRIIISSGVFQIDETVEG